MERGNSPEFISRYYDLYLRWTENRAAKRLLPVVLAKWLAARREPLWKFHATAEKLKADLSIYIASYKGQDAAGAVFLGAGRGAVYWRGASDTRIPPESLGAVAHDYAEYVYMNVLRPWNSARSFT